MASFRIPRGYKVNRPPYVEICEGQRPNMQTVPLEAYTGLGPVRIDQLHHDPIVIDAGTIVGIATGSSASGKVLPAMWNTGSVARTMVTHHHSDGAEWGLPTASGEITPGVVKPIGVCYQPVYSFALQANYSNYQRSHNVGFVTDYVIQKAVRTADEHAIRAGDVVIVADGHYSQGNLSNGNIFGTAGGAGEVGSFKRLEALRASLGQPSDAGDALFCTEFVVGRCLRNQIVATSTTSTPTKFKDDTGTITITPEGKSEFKGLNLVETRGEVSGSGTKGVPGHILEGLCNASGEYRLLTVLVRM